MTAEVLLQGIVSGLLMGFVYALIAAGLSLIFGLMEIVNFAHGEFLMLAMFSTYWAWALWRLDPVLALPLTAAVMFALGWGIGSACVGVAGALLTIFFYVFPDVGASFALLAYVTVALGGFGNVPGTLVAGVVVGVIEVLGGLLIAPALKYVAVFVLYLLVVLWRPQGLFGRF